MTPISRKGGTLLFVLAIALFFGSVITYVFWSHISSTRTMFADIDQRLILGASTLPHLLETDFHDRIGTISPREDWENIAKFTDFAANNDFSSVFTAMYVFGDLRTTAASATTRQLEDGAPVRHLDLVSIAQDAMDAALASGNPAFTTEERGGTTYRVAVFPQYSPLGSHYVAVAEYDLTRVMVELRRNDIATIAISLAFLIGILPVLYISSRIQRGHISRLALINRILTDENERRKSAEMELSARKEHLAAINRDLEDRVAAEADRLRKSERLLFEQSKFAAMGQMVGAIAHQWRQPLNALGLYVQDTKDAYDADELTPEYLADTTERAMQLVLHMSGTIDDFRNFFRSDEALHRIHLGDTTEEIIGLVKPQIASQGIALHLVRDTGDDCIMAYPGEIKQVVLNLIDNARHAIIERTAVTPEPPGLIRIIVTRSDNKVILTVEDNGIGMDPKAAERAFEPYYTTKPEGTGTGIGLYMSRIMVEEHMHGRIAITRTAPGVTFTIELPATPCSDASADHTQSIGGHE